MGAPHGLFVISRRSEKKRRPLRPTSANLLLGERFVIPHRRHQRTKHVAFCQRFNFPVEVFRHGFDKVGNQVLFSSAALERRVVHTLVFDVPSEDVQVVAVVEGIHGIARASLKLSARLYHGLPAEDGA